MGLDLRKVLIVVFAVALILALTGVVTLTDWLAGGSFLFGGAVLKPGDFIMCNKTGWLNCYLEDLEPAPKTVNVACVWGTCDTITCEHTQCRIDKFTPSCVGSPLCGFYDLYVDGLIASQKAGEYQINKTITKGKTFKATANGYFTYMPQDYRLRYSGTAATKGAGSIISSQTLSSGCGYVTVNGVWDDSGQLKKEPTADQQTVLVPFNESYQVSISEKEICNVVGADTCGNVGGDCGGHGFDYDGDGVAEAECEVNTLKIYGCRQLFDFEKTAEYCLEGGISVDTTAGSSVYTGSCTKWAGKCVIVETKPNQMSCGYCGENAVWDPATRTCKPAIKTECTTALDCADPFGGITTFCNRDLKTLTQLQCVLNKCSRVDLQAVECCTDSDCPSGFFCDRISNLYKCKEQTTPKKECPTDCCENLPGYWDKPAPPGNVCCPDGTTAKTQELCHATHSVCDGTACKLVPGFGLTTCATDKDCGGGCDLVDIGDNCSIVGEGAECKYDPKPGFVVVRSEEPILFGLLGKTETAKCEQEFPILAVILGLGIIAAVLIAAWKLGWLKKGKGKGKKRRR